MHRANNLLDNSICREVVDVNGSPKLPSDPKPHGLASKPWGIRYQPFIDAGIRACSLEIKPHRQLRLPRIADALAQEPIKVEEGRRAQGVDIVLVVERVEQLQLRRERHVLTKFERTLDTEIKREVSVVFAQMIAAAIDAVYESRNRIIHAAWRARFGPIRIVRNGLCGVRLHAEVQVETPGKIGDGIEIESMTLVAIGIGVFRIQV